MSVAPQDDPQGSAHHWSQVLIALRWPLLLLALALVAFLAFRETLDRGERAVQATAEAVDQAAVRATELAVGLAEGFRSGTINETFRSYLPTVDRSRSGLLEVGSLEMVETFERSDERRVLWDAVSLGTTVSEIHVPVTYRYHVRLDGEWRLEVDEHTCRVIAPAIQPTLPPAIHTEGLEKRSEEGWLRFDGEEQLDTLQQSITPRLRQMAGDPRHVDSVRDAARHTIAEFVRGWLLAENHWGGERFRMIQVIFADEQQSEGEESLRRPVTLTIETGGDDETRG